MSLAKVLEGLSGLSQSLMQLSEDVKALSQDLAKDDTEKIQDELKETKRQSYTIPLGPYIVDAKTIGECKSLPQNGGVIAIIGARQRGKSTLCDALQKALGVTAEKFHVFCASLDELPDLVNLKHTRSEHYFVIQCQDISQLKRAAPANVDMVLFSTEILNSKSLSKVQEKYHETHAIGQRDIYRWNHFLRGNHDGIKRLHARFNINLLIPVTLPLTFPLYSFVICNVDDSKQEIVIQ